jgi:mono/diheme cytochrome c family protein
MALTVALGACKFIPDDGYAKVSHRERNAVAEAAAPPPPVYVASAGGAAGSVPKLPAGAPANVTQAMVDEGAQSFTTVCAACHGPGGSGTAAAPSLADAQWINISGTYPEIDAIIKAGVPKPKQHPGMMPPRGGGPFTDAQVAALAAYVFALSHGAS